MNKPDFFKIGTIAIAVILGVVAVLIFSGKFPGIDLNNKKNNSWR